MYELYTPKEMISELVSLVEKERKRQRLQQKELAEKSAIPLPTYRQFVYHKKISVENLFKLLFALKLFENIDGLLKQRSVESIEEIKHKEKLPQRIRK